MSEKTPPGTLSGRKTGVSKAVTVGVRKTEPLAMNVNFKNLGGIIPQWNTLIDAGLDLHASIDMQIPPRSQVLVPLGIASEFSPTLVAFIKDRSGMALEGIHTHGGVIDSAYRGEWKVILSNFWPATYSIKRGDRVAQVIFLPCFHPPIREVKQLKESSRGVQGFGSSGR